MRRPRSPNLLLSAALLCISTLSPLPAAHAAACYRNPSVTPSDFPRCKSLSPNVTLAWAISPADGYITLALDIDGVWDWLALGLSEGGMKGADIAVCKHAGNGMFTVQDMWSEGFYTPVLDEQQDVVLVSAMQGAGSTLAVFRRPLESCDAQVGAPGMSCLPVWCFVCCLMVMILM